MKNKTRFLKIAAIVFAVVFMAISLTSCMTGGTSSARDASGTHGSLKWDYKKDDQTLTIEGSGAMTSFESNSDIAWADVVTSAKKLVVKSGVTSIGDYAFFGMTALEEVSLPAGLTSIGKLSFAYTTALKSITIPDSVTTIGYGAFETSGITAIVLPLNLTEIQANTFMYCTALTSVTGSGVASVGDKAFAYCTALTTLKLSDGNPPVKENTFEGTTLTKDSIKAADGKVVVTYNYVDADDTSKVIKSESEERTAGDAYTKDAPTIEGYTPVSNSVNVVVGNSDQTVTISYRKIETAPETEELPEDGGAESEPVTEPVDDKLEPMDIVALVVTVVIIIGIIVGVILFIRHDKKNSGSRTVRKNKDEKKDKKKKK